MEHRIFHKLQKVVKGNMVFQASLSRYTSLRVGGPAEVVLYPLGIKELQRLIQFCATHHLPYFIMGRGSNLLIRDGGIKGIVIKLSRGFTKIKVKDTSSLHTLIQVDAGVSLPRLLSFTIQQGLSGAEFLTGIPGSLGGALAMNAGAQGNTMHDITASVILMTPQGQLVEKKKQKLIFAYRRLRLPAGTIIVSALLTLQPGNQKKIIDTVKDITQWRRTTQPLDLPSAGSVFKNPSGRFAGKLVEEAGLKGFQVGRAKISEKHANFIVNLGGATAKDILTLMETVQHRVYLNCKIWLEPEITIVGENGLTAQTAV